MTEEQTPNPTPNNEPEAAAPSPPAETPAPTPPPPPAEVPTPAAAPPAETVPAAPAETATPPVDSPIAAAEPAPAPPTQPAGLHLGTGRRKSAIARVRLVPGSGKFVINRREIDKYFTEPQDQTDVTAPLQVTGVINQWDVQVRVHGGGHTGQAGAIRLGVARALVSAHEQFEPTLRDAGFLTRDARRVERKKYGQRKARRRFQFSKR